MANINFANSVRDQVKDAVEKGAKPLIDTEQVFPNDKAGTGYVAPQILVNVSHDMLVMTEETFGPILGIMKVSSDDEAIRLMNDSKYGSPPASGPPARTRRSRLETRLKLAPGS